MDYVRQVLEENLKTLDKHISEFEQREKELRTELMNVQQRLVIMEEMSKQLRMELETR